MAAVSSENIAQRVIRRLRWFVRDRFPSRPVKRTVQGVEMVLPWSHRLPDYARSEPEYGQNLPRLAQALVEVDGVEVVALDIGANIGDSALQILEVADGRVLCVEADSFYLDFLRQNVGHDPRVAIEDALLITAADQAAMVPKRVGGTTRFVVDEASTGSARTVSMDELRQRHPEFDAMRLVKSDTDGHDVNLVPAVARAYAHSRPVLFFEYDHELSRLAGHEPERVWAELEELGYDLVRIWDNGGRPLLTCGIAGMAERSAVLDETVKSRGYHFWDVAVAHRDDPAGAAAIRAVQPPDPSGAETD